MSVLMDCHAKESHPPLPATAGVAYRRRKRGEPEQPSPAHSPPASSLESLDLEDYPPHPRDSELRLTHHSFPSLPFPSCIARVGRRIDRPPYMAC